MNIRIPIVVEIAAFGLGNLVAQNSCGTDHYHEILKKSDPDVNDFIFGVDLTNLGMKINESPEYDYYKYSRKTFYARK